MRLIRTVPAAVALVFFATTAEAAQKQTVAVIDLTDKGLGAVEAKNVSDLVTAALAEVGVFEVLSRSDIERMLQFESDKQALGCESDTSCLAEIGGALGVALLISGSVGKVGDSIILNLNLTDTQGGRVLSREQRKYGDLNELSDDIAGAVRYLARTLLSQRQGDLLIRATEPGAEVEIDGKLVGETPMPRQTLAGGPHKVRVSKTGFITWAKDVDIAQKELNVVEVSLVPSAEFIREYESDAFNWRLGGYAGAGLGIAAMVFGGYTYLVYNSNRADSLNADIESSGCVADSPGQPDVNCQSTFRSRRTSIRTWDRVAIGSFFGGAVLTGVGVFLFASGPDPDLYEDYRQEAQLEPEVSWQPLDGGGLLSLRAHY